MSCGPRAGFAELIIPANEPGSSIMPGKVNPTQAEALTMIAVQVMANDVAVGFGGAGGYLEMNVYKPLIIFNIAHSVTIMTDGCTNFRKFLVEGTKPNLKKIREYVDRSLMLVTALSHHRTVLSLLQLYRSCTENPPVDVDLGVYALNKTGRIATGTNEQFLTDADLQEWNDAVDEYHQKD